MLEIVDDVREIDARILEYDYNCLEFFKGNEGLYRIKHCGELWYGAYSKKDVFDVVVATCEKWD